MKLASYYYNFKYGVRWRKPRLIWRIIKNYFNIIFRKATPLRYIDVCVDLDCNLKCSHCFAENFKSKNQKGFKKVPQKQPTLSVKAWADIIDQCHQLGNLAIGFTGGEPLLYKDLEKLIAMSKPEQTLILISTNGMLVSPERARSLYDAGVDALQVSIESIKPEEHNKFRHNNKAWELSMHGIDNALAAGLNVTVAPTVSHENVRSEGFLQLLEWAHKKKLMLSMALAAPMGEWSGRLDVLLTKEDFEFIETLIAKYPNVRRDFETNYIQRGCGAATEKLYFTPYGDTLACPYMHISFGNTKDSAVADIRANMFKIDKLQGYYPKCLVAEDHEFITGPLAKTFDDEGKIVTWEKAFKYKKSA